MTEELNHLPWENYKEIFLRDKPIPKDGNFAVKCKLCKKEYKTSVTSTGNLKKHVVTAHREKLSLIQGTPKRPTAARAGEAHDIRTLLQPGRQSNITQEELDELVLDIIIESKLPFQLVERPKFQKFVRRTVPGRSVMSRKTVSVRLAERYRAAKERLKEELAKVAAVGTTADAWKSRGKGYLGVTAHWLDPGSMERRSAALACRRVRDAQTYDVLATMIADVFLEFGIQDKVSSTVTDNGSNFCKAFREFTVFDKDNNDETDATDDDIDELLSLGDILDEGEQGGEIRLPRHRRCACHTLNLVATKDLDDYLTKSATVMTRTAWSNIMTKCRAFWSKQNRSTISQDVVKRQLGKVLPAPNATRWNSLFDALNAMVWHYGEERRAAMKAVCASLKVEALLPRELDFIQDYVKMMEPLAQTLDLLQGEKNVSVGYLLPALHNLLARYRHMEGLRQCQPCVQVLIDSITRRFEDQLWDQSLVVAACLEPTFRLDWIRGTVEGDGKVHEAREWLEEALQDLNPGPEGPEDPDEPQAEVTSNAVKKLFCFMPQRRQTVGTPAQILETYLNSANADAALKSCTHLRKLYVGHNTCLPSSASAERLFSHAGLVLSARRSCLGDTLFDQLVFLGVNQDAF